MSKHGKAGWGYGSAFVFYASAPTGVWTAVKHGLSPLAAVGVEFKN